MSNHHRKEDPSEQRKLDNSIENTESENTTAAETFKPIPVDEKLPTTTQPLNIRDISSTVTPPRAVTPQGTLTLEQEQIPATQTCGSDEYLSPAYCPDTVTLDDKDPQYIKEQQKGEPVRDKLKIQDFEFQQQKSDDENLKEVLSTETLYNKHILNGKAKVPFLPGTAVISGIKQRKKTNALQFFLSRSIRMKDKRKETALFDKTQTQLNTQCLSCYKTIVLGKRPYDTLTWLTPSADSDIAVTCLWSYFARLCKNREHDTRPDYYRLLEFAPVPATSEHIKISDPEVAEQLKLLYIELQKQWDELRKDEKQQAVAPTGVCLMNILDVGPCEAAHDLLPYINKYCKHMVSITCYNTAKDSAQLRQEFSEDNTQPYYQSSKYQLMRQLCGIHENSMVVLAALDEADEQIEEAGEFTRASEEGTTQCVTGQEDDNTAPTAPNTGHDDAQTQVDNELVKGLEEATGVKVSHIRMSTNNVNEAKCKLQKLVVEKDVFSSAEAPIHYFLLLHRIHKKRKSFWMKRSDIETLSQPYGFENGDLESCLKFFTSFGCILYTHDIPTLREYVIVDLVDFVQKIHETYHSNTPYSPYGLYEKNSDSNTLIIFEFLTTLGIAAEVKSNQIVPIQGLPPMGMFATYYYIPTARTHNKSFVTSTNRETFTCFEGYTLKNLQVHLCKCLLQKNCFLIPTKAINTTAIRSTTFLEGQEEEDFELIDEGNRAMVWLLTSDITPKRKDEVTRKLEACCSKHTQRSGQSVMDFLDQEKKIPTDRLLHLARNLSTVDKQRLLPVLEKTQKWFEEETKTREEWEVMFCIMNDHALNRGCQSLVSILKESKIKHNL